MNKLIILILLNYIGSAFTMTSLITKALKNYPKINCKEPNTHLKSYPQKATRKLLGAYKTQPNKLIRKYSKKSNLSHNKKITTNHKSVDLFAMEDRVEMTPQINPESTKEVFFEDDRIIYRTKTKCGNPIVCVEYIDGEYKGYQQCLYATKWFDGSIKHMETGSITARDIIKDLKRSVFGNENDEL